MIVLRSDSDVPDEIREKIALFTDVDVDAVIPAPTASTIYGGMGWPDSVKIVAEAVGLRTAAPRPTDSGTSMMTLADLTPRKCWIVAESSFWTAWSTCICGTMPASACRASRVAR